MQATAFVSFRDVRQVWAASKVKSLNSVVDIIDSQQDEKNRRRVPESTFFRIN
ncbi:Uncharacterised protein [Klebsiella aerogenes]|nr:Uncharacterised protein [Klebsiella aerogenes]